jgi:hypothetical protein
MAQGIPLTMDTFQVGSMRISGAEAHGIAYEGAHDGALGTVLKICVLHGSSPTVRMHLSAR